MTAIVGFAARGKVWIGGDSAGVAGLDLVVRADPKVFRVGEFLIGFTSSFRMGQLLRFKFAPPAHAAGVDDYRYLCTDWIDAVRACLRDGGYAKNESGEEHGGVFLFGYRGKLYQVCGDFQVGEPADGLASCGCGEAYAIGALAVATGSPAAKVRKALEVAARFSAGVRGPFVIESI